MTSATVNDNTDGTDSSALDQENNQEKSQDDSSATSTSDTVGATGAETDEQIDPLSEFASTLVETLDPYSVRDNIRIVRDGVFFHEQVLLDIIRAFQDWQSQRSGSNSKLETSKIIKKLFKSEHPALYYVIDGKNCLSGHIMPCAASEIKTNKLKRYQGSPQSAKDYLHPKDPVLKTLKHVSAQLSNQGLALSVNAGKHSYKLNLVIVEQFAAVARNSYRTSKFHPNVRRSIRDCIAILGQVLSRARLVKEQQQLLIPQEYRNTKAALFLKTGSLVFIVIADELKFVYELSGKNLHHFAIAELASLGRNPRQRRIGPVELVNRKGKNVASIKVKEEIFPVTIEAFKSFVSLAPRSRKQGKKFRGHYTIRECLKEIGNCFTESAWVEEIKVPREFKEHKFDTKNYRLNGDWCFIITTGRTIAACLLKESALFQRQNRSPQKNKSKGLSGEATDRESKKDSPKSNDPPKRRRRRQRRRKDRPTTPTTPQTAK